MSHLSDKSNELQLAMLERINLLEEGIDATKGRIKVLEEEKEVSKEMIQLLGEEKEKAEERIELLEEEFDGSTFRDTGTIHMIAINAVNQVKQRRWPPWVLAIFSLGFVLIQAGAFYVCKGVFCWSTHKYV